MRAFSIGLSFFLAASSAAGLSLDEGLRQRGLTPGEGSKGFSLGNSGEGADGVLNAKAGDVLRRIQVREAGPVEARKWVALQRQIIQSAYATKPSPYMAPVTKELTCAKDFRPVTRKTGGTEYISAVTNSRLAYGACAREQAGYSAGVRFFYDGRVLVKSECFVPYGREVKVLEDCVRAAPVALSAKGIQL